MTSSLWPSSPTDLWPSQSSDDTSAAKWGMKSVTVAAENWSEKELPAEAPTRWWSRGVWAEVALAAEEQSRAGELDRVEDELALAALDGRLARLVQVDVEHEQALQRLDGRPATERQLLAKEEGAGGLREHPVVPEPHPDVGHDHLQPVWRAVGQQLRRGELLPPPLEVVVAGAQLEDERLKVDQAHVPGGEGLRSGAGSARAKPHLGRTSATPRPHLGHTSATPRPDLG